MAMPTSKLTERGRVVFRHGSLHPLFGGDVERGVHHVAEEVDIASLDELERFERDDRQGILHFAAARREASREAHVALLVEAEVERAAAFDVDVARLVVAEFAAEVCRLADVQGHREVHAHDGRRGRSRGRAVGEIDEVDKPFELVFDREGRVFQDVGHVGVAEQVEPSVDVDVLHRAAHRGVNVRIDFPEHHRLALSLGIDELVVRGVDVKVHSDGLGVRKVDGTVEAKRRRAGRVEREVFHGEPVVVDDDGRGVHAQRDAVDVGEDAGRVEAHAAVGHELVGRAV